MKKSKKLPKINETNWCNNFKIGQKVFEVNTRNNSPIREATVIKILKDKKVWGGEQTLRISVVYEDGLKYESWVHFFNRDQVATTRKQALKVQLHVAQKVYDSAMKEFKDAEIFIRDVLNEVTRSKNARA